MCGNIFVNQAADHLLIFQAMFVGLGLKKVHTVFRYAVLSFSFTLQYF
jgi:hypothetical protein